MLDQGLEVEKIIQYTNLSETEIRSIQKDGICRFSQNEF